MKVLSPLIEYFHLDPAYALLSLQNTLTALQIFQLMDIHGTKSLNDIIFDFYLKHNSDLQKHEINVVFSLLDADLSGAIEFREFYIIFSALIATKDQYEKEFIYRHSNCIFRLIDTDNSGQISIPEFTNMGILFNFSKSSVRSIFNEFDISGDKHLDLGEFKLFTMACIDEQRIASAQKKVKAFRDYNHRLVNNLTPSLKRYIKSRRHPRPEEIESIVDSTRPPYMIRTYDTDLFEKISNVLYKIAQGFLKVWRCLIRCLCPRSKSKKGNWNESDLGLTKTSKSKCCCGKCRCCCCKRKVADDNSGEGMTVEKGKSHTRTRRMRVRSKYSMASIDSKSRIQFHYNHFDR